MLNRTWKPIVRHYLRKQRKYKYGTISVLIDPGVFHPGFFYSTKALLNFIAAQDLNRKKIIEAGCGCGILSIACAHAGAQQFAFDLSEKAMKCAENNFLLNNVEVRLFCSDLFEKIPAEKFDLILVNPPFYSADPATTEDRAWYAGKDLEFFRRFFRDAGDFISRTGKIIMVLSDDCDRDKIFHIASESGWKEELLKTEYHWGESVFIYELQLQDYLGKLR